MTTFEPPAEFAEGLLELRGALIPDDLTVREIRAPEGLAPHAAAIRLATNAERGGQPLAHSTLAILFDPEQEELWGAPFRMVGHVRAQIDAEVSSDPILVDLTWADFLSSLTEAGAELTSPMGTVTRELSETFGGLELRASALNIELRCSWTPVNALDAQLSGWANFVVLCAGAAEDHGFGLEVHGA